MFILAFLFLAVLAFGGWHLVAVVLFHGLHVHPLHALVQLVVIVLLYHLGRKLIDQIGKSKS